MFVINSLGTGGAERSLAEMLPPLMAGGVDPVVVCLRRFAGGVESEVREKGPDLRFLTSRHLGLAVFELRRLVGQLGPDLVHTTLFEADVAGRLAALGTGVPVLTSLVNTTYEPARLADPGVSARKLYPHQVVDGWTARRFTAHFHAITHAVKRSAVRGLRIPPERITVIERGRDPSRLGAPGPSRRRRVRRRLGLDQADEVIVNVGRQEFQKGQLTLVRAIAHLVDRRPRVVLLQAGRRGALSIELETLTRRLGLTGHVRFLGQRDDVADLLAAADLFAFPSVYEGLGGAVIEAMALGLPIVASDLPALREVVEPDGNAVLVPAGRPGELAASLEGLLDDESRRTAFGQRSREIFEERFTLPRGVEEMLGLYVELTDGRYRPKVQVP